MSVKLKLLKSSGALYEIPCESINDAAQLAEMSLTMGETPLAILIDGRIAYDEKALSRLVKEILIY